MHQIVFGNRYSTQKNKYEVILWFQALFPRKLLLKLELPIIYVAQLRFHGVLAFVLNLKNINLFRLYNNFKIISPYNACFNMGNLFMKIKIQIKKNVRNMKIT